MKNLRIVKSETKENKTRYYLTNNYTIIVENNSVDYTKDFSAKLFNITGRLIGEAHTYEAISPVSGDRIEENYMSTIPEEYTHILHIINEDLYPCCLLTDWEAGETKFEFDGKRPCSSLIESMMQMSIEEYCFGKSLY